MITIKQTSNGCVVKYGKEEELCYPFSEDNLEDLHSLFYDLIEELSPPNSRYSKQRLQVSIVHGDKYECKDKNCEICSTTP